MAKRVARLLVEDIADSIDTISTYLTNRTAEDLVADRQLRDAVVLQLLVIGEASNKLPPNFKTANTTISWQKMTDMRNKLIHEYFEVDLTIVWQVYMHDLPVLRNQLQHILNNFPDE